MSIGIYDNSLIIQTFAKGDKPFMSDQLTGSWNWNHAIG